MATWIFTDPNSHLTGTTTVIDPLTEHPGRAQDDPQRADATTSKSLSFVGPDGGTPIVIAPGKTANILCTDTYTGSGGFVGTWIRETADA